MSRVASFLTGVVLLSLLSANAAGQDWPRWRGPNDNGSTESGSWPVRLQDDDVLWRAPLPGKGCSTPIVVNRTIYVTAPVDGKDALLAYDWSGKQKWRTTFGAEDAGKHRNGSGSNASPVSDGKGIYVYFKSGTLAAVEPDGTIRWSTNLVEQFGKAKLYWDHGTSPVLTEKSVVFARMHEGDSWVAAFDKQTGNEQWKVARNYKTPTEGDHGYATPLVLTYQGKESVLVWGAEHLTLHDAASGRVAWSCGNFNPDAKAMWPSISTPVIIDDTAVLAFGRNDRQDPRLHGIHLKGKGDVTATGHAWTRKDTGTFVPTPVAFKKHVYVVRDRGEVECVDPASGKTLWNNAFPRHRAKYYASPLIAGGILYAPREDGVVFVARVSRDGFELLSENDMGESVIGSPIPSENRLFIRGQNHLFCIGTSDS